MKLRGEVTKWCALACHGSQGGPMLNEPGKLLARFIMWVLIGINSLCYPMTFLLVWLIERNIIDSTPPSVLIVLVNGVQPVSGILAACFFLSTLIWPRRRIPAPVANVETESRTE
jgi:hypothetical protein